MYLDWQEGRMTRKLALARLAELHMGQMEVLKKKVKEGVRIQVTQVENRARDIMEEMDREYLNGMVLLEIQNAGERIDALSKLNDIICAKIAEIRGKNWPQEMKDEAVDQAFALKARVATRIMKELGSE